MPRTLFQNLRVASSGLRAPHLLLSYCSMSPSPRSSFSTAVFEYGRLSVQSIISSPSLCRSSLRSVSISLVLRLSCAGLPYVSCPRDSYICSTLRSRLIEKFDRATHDPIFCILPENQGPKATDTAWNHRK